MTTMKDDTISRAAALDALDKVAEMFPYRIPGKAKTYRQYNEAWSDAIDAAENALEVLPSAQPGWIPCSERLPERYDNYLITTKDEDTDIGTYHPEFKQWSICDADGFRLTDGVLAWCELPKPWEGDANG